MDSHKKYSECVRNYSPTLLPSGAFLAVSICAQQLVHNARGARESISLSVFCAPHQIKLSYLYMTIRWRVRERETRGTMHCVLAESCARCVCVCVLMLRRAARQSLFLTLVYTMTGACTKKSRGSSSGPQ